MVRVGDVSETTAVSFGKIFITPRKTFGKTLRDNDTKRGDLSGSGLTKRRAWRRGVGVVVRRVG